MVAALSVYWCHLLSFAGCLPICQCPYLPLKTRQLESSHGGDLLPHGSSAFSGGQECYCPGDEAARPHRPHLERNSVSCLITSPTASSSYSLIFCILEHLLPIRSPSMITPLIVLFVPWVPPSDNIAILLPRCGASSRGVCPQSPRFPVYSSTESTLPQV